MERDHMRNSLEKLGIPPDDFRVLKLLPLIYVAWADGTIEAELGDDAKALPPKVRAFFRELTYEELRVLAQLQQTMKGQAGLYEEVQTFRGTATLGKL